MELRKLGCCAFWGGDILYTGFFFLITPLQEEYFRQGLRWHREYPLAEILGSAGVIPGGNYTWLEVFKAVESELDGKNPAVQCEYDEVAKTRTLSQILICFDKRLRVVDCDGIAGGINIGCPRRDKFLYPGPARYGRKRRTSRRDFYT